MAAANPRDSFDRALRALDRFQETTARIRDRISSRLGNDDLFWMDDYAAATRREVEQELRALRDCLRSPGAWWRAGVADWLHRLARRFWTWSS